MNKNALARIAVYIPPGEVSGLVKRSVCRNGCGRPAIYIDARMAREYWSACRYFDCVGCGGRLSMYEDRPGTPTPGNPYNVTL